MSNLHYFCLCICGVQHIMCCVLVLFDFVLCTICCQFLWIVHLLLPLRFSLAVICVYVNNCILVTVLGQ